MAEKFSLKDHLFNQAKVEYLGRLLVTADATFPYESFVARVMAELSTLELKDRIRHIASVLRVTLPADYREAVNLIVRALPPPLDPTKTDDDFGDFIFAPFGEYVAQYGCTKENLSLSLQTLRELTKRFSMEDAIRHFLRGYTNETLAELSTWVTDENYHVRRLVSEGTRPLLPWSGRVPLKVADTLPLLTALHADSTRYVTRSVANHLNDIAKTDPKLVVGLLKSWHKSKQQTETELKWMIKHALRTLIKQGHQDALLMLGYEVTTCTVVSFMVTPTEIKIDERIQLTATLQATPGARLLIDYRVHFVKKNGTTAVKVFKWKTCTVDASGEVSLIKSHHLKANATTFTLYPGEHAVELQVNGHQVQRVTFNLQA